MNSASTVTVTGGVAGFTTSGSAWEFRSPCPTVSTMPPGASRPGWPPCSVEEFRICSEPLLVVAESDPSGDMPAASMVIGPAELPARRPPLEAPASWFTTSGVAALLSVSRMAVAPPATLTGPLKLPATSTVPVPVCSVVLLPTVAPEAVMPLPAASVEPAAVDTLPE